MHGFLLAAGFGTRLWPLSDVRAKPAFPYLGVPLIRYVADMVVDAGVDRLWVNTHHAPGSVKEALHGYDKAQVLFAHEQDILGTAGGIVNIAHELAADEVWIANAKIASDLNLRAVVDTHRRTGAVATMVCVPNSKRELFTHVDTVDGMLRGFIPKEDLSTVAAPLTYTGIQLVSRRFFDFLPPPGFSDTVKDVYPRILAAGQPVAVHQTTASWREFSTVARYLDLHLEVTNGAGFIDSTAAIEGTVERSVVWPRVQVEAGALLRECVVGADVVVPSSLEAERASIVRLKDIKDWDEVVKRGGFIVGDLAVTPIT